jgi:hypothetical protein
MEITKDVRESGSLPSKIELGLKFSEEEIDGVFAADQEALFSKIFSPRWDGLAFSEKLAQLVALAQFLEAQAANLNLSGGDIVPK